MNQKSRISQKGDEMNPTTRYNATETDPIEIQAQMNVASAFAEAMKSISAEAIFKIFHDGSDKDAKNMKDKIHLNKHK